MANLCPTCKNKPTPAGTYRGQCQAAASTDCKAWTDDFTLTLCDPCAEQLGRCAWCSGPITGGWGAQVPTPKQFVPVFQKDNGIHVTGMNVGEQILVKLQVDLYSGYSWQFKAYRYYSNDPNMSSKEVSLYGHRMIRDPRNWRQGTLEMYIDLNGAAESAKIVLEEASNWYSSSSGSTWQCTVEIKR